ncbi:unnamed protein product [Ilex paraguariensis]|uniref:Secreted protein n=1 Tax=Ilex paraguariensis TaxID=185542 RepID=A0ABC8SSF8_9AQUA
MKTLQLFACWDFPSCSHSPWAAAACYAYSLQTPFVKYMCSDEKENEGFVELQKLSGRRPHSSRKLFAQLYMK